MHIVRYRYLINIIWHTMNNLFSLIIIFQYLLMLQLQCFSDVSTKKNYFPTSILVYHLKLSINECSDKCISNLFWLAFNII